MSETLAILSDQDLIVRIRAGEKRAFEAFYLRYHALVYHLSLRFLKNSEQAEEAVQDVFLKFWQNRSVLDPDRSGKGYLLRTCKNHLLNQIAKKGIRLEPFSGRDDDIAAAGSPVDDLVYLEYTQILERGIAQLPEQRQRIFRLYRLESKSIDEIANELGTGKGTIKDHLLKANRHLKAYLKSAADIRFEMMLLLLLFSEAVGF